MCGRSEEKAICHIPDLKTSRRRKRNFQDVFRKFVFFSLFAAHQFSERIRFAILKASGKGERGEGESKQLLQTQFGNFE
jgi:hypothetical protein